MKARLFFVLTCAAAAVWLAGGEARACSCFMPSEPCALYWDADVIFVGTVKEVGPMTPVEGQPRAASPSGRVTRFGVEEAFRGVAGAAAETAERGTSCDYDFKVGARYLVYGKRDPSDGRTYVFSCSGTKQLEHAAGDLAFARDVAAGRPTPSVAGRVIRETRETAASYRSRRALDGVEVVVAGGGREAKARTDAEGNFRVFGLPPGAYDVRVRTPTELRHLYEPPARQLQVAPGRCSVAEFVVTSLSTLSGRVVDDAGAPARATRLSLVPLDAEGREVKPAEGSIETYTNDEGRYKFDHLSPGRYRVAVNPGGQPGSYDPPFPRVFLPGVSDPARAAVVNVSEGEAYEAEEFRLPPRLVAREIVGAVVTPDGTPVPRALLSLEFTEREWSETTSAADEHGRFRLKAFKGFRYLVTAEVRTQDAGGRWVARHSTPVEVTVGETNEPVRLVVEREGFYRPRYDRRKQEKR
ncbi:MAG TPA: carboxypeptidase regulatory-like domain-containing protein [Pyrinomonadaceae bacterium]|nr:carboxypeptidase regulatory-like domain-containing protein [Pyrinomonadaceae bacterium]